MLVVEDTEVNQVVATLMLGKCGFRAQVAANGREALEALSRGSFVAALMDCQMPELDGYETTREIRRRERRGRHMPIIAMTANAMQGERERCLAAGMDDYVTKPLRNRALEETLARWVTEAPPPPDPTRPAGPAASHAVEHPPASHAVEHPPASHAVEHPPARAGPPRLLDEAVVAELESLDRDTLADIVSLYLDQASASMYELGAAVDRGELLTVTRTAHELKGASAAIGAVRVAQLAAALQASATTGERSAAGRLVGELREGLGATGEAFRARAARPTPGPPPAPAGLAPARAPAR